MYVTGAHYVTYIRTSLSLMSRRSIVVCARIDRSLTKALATLVGVERPHVIGLQETKIQTQHVQEMTDQLEQLLPDYTTFCELCFLFLMFSCSHDLFGRITFNRVTHNVLNLG